MPVIQLVCSRIGGSFARRSYLAILECVFWKLPLLTSVTSTNGCSPNTMMYRMTPVTLLLWSHSPNQILHRLLSFFEGMPEVLPVCWHRMQS